MSGVQQFDYSVNTDRVILWQYNNATNLQKLLAFKQAWLDVNHQQFWQDFYRDVYDLRTANEFGLRVWAKILGMDLFVSTPPDTNKVAWGFGEFRANFNNGNFSDSTGSTNELTLEVKRIALRLRMYQIIGTVCVPQVNRMLADVFKDYGKVYLINNMNKTQTYVFNFNPSYDLSYLINNYDILPRPAGVYSNYYVMGIEYFGFGNFRANFDNGGFAPEGLI
jgi:hypothetical protein